MPPPEAGVPEAGVPAAMARNTEKCPANISIDTFKTGVDDFEEWIEMFESAVVLGTNALGDRKEHFYKAWLPHKLDRAARAIYKEAQSSTYPELKAELQALLVDPQEQYKWQAKKTKITWNGEESFHALATRVKATVDRYDKEMNGASKAREYFFRFRESLPKTFQDAIDIGCPEEDRTIDQAKKIALRVQMTMGNNCEPKVVGFTAAAYTENRGIEMALAAIETRLSNIEVSTRTHDEKFKKWEQSREASRERYEKRYPRTDRRDSSGGDNRRDNRPDRGGRRDDRRRDDSRRDDRRRDSQRDSQRDSKRDSRRDNQRDSRRNGQRNDRRGDQGRRRETQSGGSYSTSRERGGNDEKRWDKNDDRKYKKKEDYNAIKTDDESSHIESEDSEEDQEYLAAMGAASKAVKAALKKGKTKPKEN